MVRARTDMGKAIISVPRYDEYTIYGTNWLMPESTCLCDTIQ